MKHQINVVFVQSVEEFKDELIYQKVANQEYYQTKPPCKFGSLYPIHMLSI